MIAPVTIDFETFKIDARPYYPPAPVGVAIKYPGEEGQYYSWGHVSGGNTSSAREANAALDKAWGWEGGLCFHNAKFDLAVAEKHFKLPRLPWQRYHDTMILLFLDDPNSKELGLKPSAKRLLGMAPEEQDAVAEWLWQHQPVPGVKIGKSPRGKEPPGAYISHAPGDVVAPYAIGDVVRTERLFELLRPRIVAADMGAAYARERRLMLLLMDNEARGLRVDTESLGVDELKYTRVLERCDRWIRKRIGADIDISAKQQLAEALVACGAATREDLGITKTGKIASNKEALGRALKDPELTAMLGYRGFLATSLQTFIRPWVEATGRTGGTLHTSWNQVHSAGAAGVVGTRTGRPSTSNPNFLNVPKKAKAFDVPVPLPPLPSMRDYILPRENGQVILDRDYSQQEPRLLAHFEGDAMMRQYQEDPWIDFHDNAKAMLEAVTGGRYERKTVKNINLGLIYGMGVGTMAEKSGVSVSEVREIKAAILGMYPGLKALNEDMKQRAKLGVPLRTWGGRVYKCEDPVEKDGKVMTFEYKMVNTLIQGSAADVTKEAMLRYADAAPLGHELLLQVYDQLVVSCPAEDIHTGMETLRETMESIEMDVPMLSEGAWSPKSWGAVKDYDVKGKRVWLSA